LTLGYLTDFISYFKLIRQKVSLAILEMQSYNLYIYNMTYSTTFYYIEITYKNHDI